MEKNDENTEEKKSLEGKPVKDPEEKKEVKKKMSMADFTVLKKLGEGSYAKVLKIKHRETEKVFAVKIVSKSFMRKEKKEYQVKIERDVLINTSHPGIIRLHYCFRDAEKLYFVLEYAPHGELFELLNLAQTFPYPVAQHYAAEIVNMLEYLHRKGIAHRDLKPENILLSEEYHLKLADFGTAKFMDVKTEEDPLSRTNKGSTFVGTAEYVSPEVLLDKESGPYSDLWALGCIIYQFFAGIPPFKSKTEFLTFEAIIKAHFSFPPGFPPAAKNLCQKLLVLEPMRRLGSGPNGSPLSFEQLKTHEFFKGIDFENIHKIKPPLDPVFLKKYEASIAKPDKPNKEELEDLELELEETHLSKPKPSSFPIHEDKVIREGVVNKKCGWLFYSKRKLVLTSRPRLSYYEPDKGEYKGDILLTKKVKAVQLGERRFDIVTPSRTYYFKGSDDSNTKEWVRSVNQTIKEFCPEI